MLRELFLPDYTRLVYPAVYYYPDSASVACDIFVIPLDGDENKLERILKANVARRNPDPILSTEKVIDNFAAFRTITPVDFSEDGTKILLKRKKLAAAKMVYGKLIYTCTILIIK